MHWPVSYTRKARFSDTDRQGIVFNANYLVYADDALTDYFEAIGMPWDVFVSHGYEAVVGRVEIDFRSPGRFGDVIETRVRVDRVGTTSIVFAFQAVTGDPERVLVEGREVYVVLDAATHEKRPVPDAFVEAVEAVQAGPVR
jgi:YbgC/YbaW family acyl-CoA thioester hydrolase